MALARRSYRGAGPVRPTSGDHLRSLDVSLVWSDQVWHHGIVTVQVNIYEAKTHLSQLVDRAAAGEDIIIARNGRPVVRLCPLSRTPGRRTPGTLRGRIRMAPDFDETPDEIIEMFHGGADIQ